MYAVLVFALSRPVLPLLVAVCALSAFGIGYLGVLSAVFDFFAQFTTQWLVIALMAVAASFAVRHAYTILASGLVFACIIPVSLASWYGVELGGQGTSAAAQTVKPLPATALAASTGMTSRHRFKLLTYNTYNLNTELDAILAEIRRHDADVVVLIELGPNKARLRQQLAKEYRFFETCENSWNCAIGLFSRLPVRRFQVVGPHDDAGPSLISAEIELGASSVTVVGAHVLSPNHGPRANYAELDHLAERVRRHRGPVLVAGDFNTTIWANAFDNFRRKSGLNHMGHLIPTWPVQPLPLPQIGIDHIFVSPDLHLSGVAAGRAGGSDHLPLVATVEVAGVAALVHNRPFEQLGTVDGLDRNFESRALAVDVERHFDAGGTKRPNAAEEGGKVVHFLVADANHDIADLKLRVFRRAVRRDARDHDLAVDFSRIEAEPRTRWPVGAADLEQVFQNRF